MEAENASPQARAELYRYFHQTGLHPLSPETERLCVRSVRICKCLLYRFWMLRLQSMASLSVMAWSWPTLVERAVTMMHILHLRTLGWTGGAKNKGQVNIWEHANLWPLFLEESFVADDHHRFYAGLGDGMTQSSRRKLCRSNGVKSSYCQTRREWHVLYSCRESTQHNLEVLVRALRVEEEDMCVLAPMVWM